MSELGEDFEVEVRWHPTRFRVYLIYNLAGKTRRDFVIDVRLNVHRIDAKKLLNHVLSQLSWLMSKAEATSNEA